jgi:hypothetical protein
MIPTQTVGSKKNMYCSVKAAVRQSVGTFDAIILYVWSEVAQSPQKSLAKREEHTNFLGCRRTFNPELDVPKQCMRQIIDVCFKCMYFIVITITYLKFNNN